VLSLVREMRGPSFSPRFSLEQWERLTPYKNPGDLQRDLDALRRRASTDRSSGRFSSQACHRSHLLLSPDQSVPGSGHSTEPHNPARSLRSIRLRPNIRLRCRIRDPDTRNGLVNRPALLSGIVAFSSCWRTCASCRFRWRDLYRIIGYGVIPDLLLRLSFTPDSLVRLT
jgi:hypothetical protein